MLSKYIVSFQNASLTPQEVSNGAASATEFEDVGKQDPSISDGQPRISLFDIDEQLTAYRELVSYPNPGIPPAIFLEVLDDAEREWPDDYLMQLCRVDERVSMCMGIKQLAANAAC